MSEVSAMSRAAIAKELPYARFLFVVVGIGAVFPYAALTQPVDYWSTTFPDYDVEFIVAAEYTWVNLVAIVAIMTWGAIQPDYDTRMLGGFLGQFFALFIIPTSSFINLSETVSLIIILVATAIAAIVTSAIDSCLFSFASRYPDEYKFQEAVMIGWALGELIGSMYRVLTKWAADEEPEQIIVASIVYFYMGSLTVLFCVYAYYSITNMKVTAELSSKERGQQQQLLQRGDDDTADAPHSHSPLCNKNNDYNDDDSNVFHHQAPSELDLLLSGPMPDPDESSAVLWESVSLDIIYPNTKASGARDEKRREAAFLKVWWNELVIGVHYFTTFSMFPGVFSVIPAYQFTSLNDSGWWTQFILLDSSTFNVISRFFTHWRFGITPQNIHLFVFGRSIIFIPLILFCASGIITSDVATLVIISAFATTHGWLATLNVIVTNEIVTDAGEKAIVGTITYLVIAIGCFIAATVAWGLDWMLG
jgi:hypothetical protein